MPDDLPSANHRLPESLPPPHSSERQRTVQACDKCRERKTKCSGEHPVCQRCTTRGLICQYSSREPRTRGPSKARLRHAVSSADLCSSPSPRVQSFQRPSRHYPHVYNVQPEYHSIRRAVSNHSPPGSRNSLNQRPALEQSREAYMHLPYQASTPLSLTTPSSAVNTAPPQASQQTQWRDIRRVQSHSALIGSSACLNRNIQPPYFNVYPFDAQAAPTSHGYWSSHDQATTSSTLAMFDAFEDSIQSAPQIHSTSRVHPWGHQIDPLSIGPEPSPGGEVSNLNHSPSSSESVSDHSAHYIGANVQPWPPQNGCPPQFPITSMFSDGGNHIRQSATASTIIRPASTSGMHVSYQQVVHP